VVQVDTPDGVVVQVPLPARMRRVIVRVTRNVTTKATKSKSSGSLSGSSMFRSHHDTAVNGTTRSFERDGRG
jgi:hypothetical protein